MWRIAPVIEALRASLSHSEATIAKVTGIPDRIDLDTIFKLLDDGLVKIHSNKGGGDLSHLAFNMDPTEYIAFGGTPFAMATNPGELNYVAPVWNQAARQDERLIYDTQYFNWDLERNVQTLMSKLPETAYLGLHDERSKYRRVTIYQMNQHLMLAYGEKTTTMLLNNETNMQKAYDCSSPSLAELFKRQNEYHLFAADMANVISDDRWMLWTFKIIEDSGFSTKVVRSGKRNQLHTKRKPCLSRTSTNTTRSTWINGRRW